VVSEEFFDICAELVSDRVILFNSREVYYRIFNYLSVLNPDTANFRERAIVRTVCGNPLGDNSDRFSSIKSVLAGISEESVISHSEGVEVASIFVTDSTIAVATVTTFSTFATVLSVNGAYVRSVGSRDRVGFPNVHFITASTIVSDSRVWIVGAWFPLLAVGLSVDPFEIVRALRVTVTSTIFSTSLVGWVFAQASILLHFYEVESAVQTARKVRHINSESKFTIQKFEHLVVAVVLEKVCTGSNVGTVWTVGDEPQVKRVATCCYSICSWIVGSINCSVFRARLRIWAL